MEKHNPKPTDKEKERKPRAAKSIIDLAIEYKINPIFIVDNSISGFLEAHVNSKEVGIKMIFGLLLTITTDGNIKSKESEQNNHKLIVFAKNDAGYRQLIKISSLASTDFFYYTPRMDMANLKRLWSDDLTLAVPFYDSFLFNNTLTFNTCLPDFGNIKPVFFTEDNSLPFDPIVQNKVKEYAKDMFTVIPAKTICYEKKSDFLQFFTRRTIANRSTLEKPRLEHFTSDEFCLESALNV